MKLTTMKRSILSMALLLGAAGCTSQADSAGINDAPSPRSTLGPTHAGAPHAVAAAESLRTLAHLVTPKRTLGFRSVSEASSASLADGLPMFIVGLDDLRSYRVGADPRPLLKDEAKVMYPVTVGGDVRSAVIVRKVNGNWRATQFGGANLANVAHAGRKHVAAARGVAEPALSLVEIPTMSARLLEHEEGGEPMLTALLDVPGTDLRAGETLPAADVFAKLQPLAAHNDGKAPN
jgi:hypothetical protein